MSLALVLSGHYDRDSGIDQYIMALVDPDKGQLNEWMVTTSHAKGQKRGDQYKLGGLIPPVHHCKNIDKWEVNLIPEDSSHVKGVEGNFYRILPYEVVTNKGTKRSALGIHKDANAPGSLGCIVMNPYNWEDFEKTMRKIKQQYGLKRVSLFPFYS